MKRYYALAAAGSQWGFSISMCVLAKLLNIPGWLERHVLSIQASMRARAVALMAALDAHLDGLATWRAPVAGMFLWLRISAGECALGDLVDGMREHGVVAIPGSVCAAGTEAPPTSRFVRLSYCLDATEYDEAARRLALLLRPAGPRDSLRRG